MADDTSAFTTATSVEPEIGTSHLRSSHLREDPMILDCLDGPTTTTKSSTRPLDRPTSPSAALPQHPCRRVVGEDEHGAAAVASPPSAITQPPSPQSKAQNTAFEEQDWDITKIVGKRRAGKDCEYKVRWSSTWLPRTQLGNAQLLLQEFEAGRRSQRGGKRIRRVRTDRVR